MNNTVHTQHLHHNPPNRVRLKGDPPTSIDDPHISTGRAWYLFSDEMKIFVRFLEIGSGPTKLGADQKCGTNIRISWHDPKQGPTWRDWDTDYANAYCPIWYAQNRWEELHRTGYYHFIPSWNTSVPIEDC